MIDDGADGSDLIEIQRPESKKVKGQRGTFIDSAAFAGPFSSC